MDGVLTETKKPKTKALKIESIGSVNNPNSIHGIYPYRGKISAIDAISVINQLKSGVLLDPFCGSGTIVYEANKAGLKSVGIDNNPLACWIANGKIASFSIKKDIKIKEITDLIEKAKKTSKKATTKTSNLLDKAFHPSTLSEVNSLLPFFNRMDEYSKTCFLGAIALVARGCNQYMWTSSTVGKDIQPKKYINFYEKFLHKIKKHVYEYDIKDESFIHQHDSRKLSEIIPENSVDYVFTSPPYFDALDYTAYYGQIIYELFDMERVPIKKELIQNTKTYEDDMRQVLNELIKVTKEDALIIFVVGDKKIKNQIINGGDFFSKLLHHQPNKIIERQYTGSSSQIFDKLNKTKRKEQIVIWDKSTWK
jgi:DNA modification methylase